jgi:hypothetical protein
MPISIRSTKRPFLTFLRLLGPSDRGKTRNGHETPDIPHWPSFIQLPIPGAPGDALTAERTKRRYHTVRYVCQACSFTASFDPRDMHPDNATQIFLLHFTQDHAGAKHA